MNANDKQSGAIYYKGEKVLSPSVGYAQYFEKFGEPDLEFTINLPWQLEEKELLDEGPMCAAEDEEFGKYLSSCAKKNEPCNKQNFFDFFYLKEDGKYHEDLLSIVSDNIEDFIERVDKSEPDFIR